MDDERKGSPWIVWCSGIIVLLALYVGAYAVTVVQDSPMMTGPIRLVPQYPYYEIPINMPDSAYIALEILFAPIHYVDRHVRPDYWADKVPSL